MLFKCFGGIRSGWHPSHWIAEANRKAFSNDFRIAFLVSSPLFPTSPFPPSIDSLPSYIAAIVVLMRQTLEAIQQ